MFCHLSVYGYLLGAPDLIQKFLSTLLKTFWGKYDLNRHIICELSGQTILFASLMLFSTKKSEFITAWNMPNKLQSETADQFL